MYQRTLLLPKFEVSKLFSKETQLKRTSHHLLNLATPEQLKAVGRRPESDWCSLGKKKKSEMAPL